MNKKNLVLINKFANDHVLAANIKVDITDHHKSFTPRGTDSYAKYEDANLLAGMIVGAESFLYYLERHGYVIGKKK